MTGNDISSIYRLRISNYGILFHINKEDIKILKVNSRDDIYK